MLNGKVSFTNVHLKYGNHRYIRVATFEDVKYLSTRLRKCDQEELKAFGNYSSLTGLLQGLLYSELPLVVVNENKPVAMFGVVSLDDLGLIWFLGTEQLKDVSLPFLRECRDVVKMFNNKHKLLANFVYAKNELHIKWLRWCGFKFIKLHEKYGYEQKQFYEFVRLGNV